MESLKQRLEALRDQWRADASPIGGGQRVGTGMSPSSKAVSRNHADALDAILATMGEERDAARERLAGVRADFAACAKREAAIKAQRDRLLRAMGVYLTDAPSVQHWAKAHGLADDDIKAAIQAAKEET